MDEYEQKILKELKAWQKKMTRKPTFTDKVAKNIQTRVNHLIPQKAHAIITSAIKNMVIAVLAGSEFITKNPIQKLSMEQREIIVRKKIAFYKRTASLEGAGTGAGGIFIGLADFPLLLTIKMKFLFDIASVYGFDVRDLKERIYILYLFQLAFSSRQKRGEIYSKIFNWDEFIEQHPPSMESIDWQTFQQEYRDYIDLAKMLQLVPGIGAFVGAYANYKLLDELGETAMNGYRLRLLLEPGPGIGRKT
ncbi:MAG: EcsC family protein [Peptococcaceae bacterium]|nr:EcsC family protein [Peptococcaceae bacterium]